MAAIVFFVGCAMPAKEPAQLCPGRQSAAEALAFLRNQSAGATSLKAIGRCRLYMCSDDRKEDFTVRIWMNPPSQIRLHGDVAFNASGIDIGSNEHEFWLIMKPKEVRSYRWGKWAGQNSYAGIEIAPKLLLEALGITHITPEDNWSLSKEVGFDVLSKRSSNTITQKIYINNCDYRISRIEYFNSAGKQTIVTKLGKYKQVTKGFFVPGLIEITNQTKDKSNDSFSLTFELSSVKTMDFTEKKRDIFFTRPEPKGFNNVLTISNTF